MGRWSREEIEETFAKWQAAALKGAQTNDWDDWVNCYTNDANYWDHNDGRFWGRASIKKWITELMTPWPVELFTAFPVDWYVIDEDRGWVVCKILNRLEDIGDGKLYEASNITKLHYAGNGMWSYEEDVFNPQQFVELLTEYLQAKQAIEAQSKEGRRFPNVDMAAQIRGIAG